MKTRILLLSLIVCQLIYSQNSPLSYKELSNYSNKRIQNTLSEGERVSLIISKIALSDFNSELPDKVLEITCTLKRNDDTEDKFYTYHRKIFQSNETLSNVNDEGFFILKDESLSRVEKINIQIRVRSINNEQSKVFKIISSLISSTVGNISQIESIRNLLEENGEIEKEEEVPLFNATYDIPNNFVNYNQREKEDLDLPILKPKQDNFIAFTSESSNLPESTWKKVTNIVLGSEYLKDKENISGLIVLKATKSAPDPPIPVIHQNLKKIGRNIGSYSIAKLKAEVEQTLSDLEIAYSTEESKSTSGYYNSQFFLSLLKVYIDYQETSELGPKDFYRQFEKWYFDRQNFSRSEDQSIIKIKEIYPRLSDDPSNALRTVDFFVPNNLDNRLILKALYMQFLMHSDFNENENTKKIKKMTSSYIKD